MLTKRSFCFYNLSNFFLIVSETFSDSCLNIFNRFVETAFHVFRRNFVTLLEKFLIVSWSKDLERNSHFFLSLDEPFPQGCQKAFSSPGDYIVEKFLFLKNLYYCFPFSNFERKSIGFWKKITALLLKLDEICSVDHLEERIFPKKR